MRAIIIAVALAVVGVQALTDEQKEKIKAYHKDCSAESGVDQDLISKARKGEFVDDAKLKEHLFCFSKKAGFQNDAGDIQEDVIRTKLNAELKDLDATNKLITKCAVKKDTPQQTAFDTIKCYYENTPTHVTLA
ncbi:PBP GOBP domain containing protein [Asbolus verrucosus]|uniref:PBP GOBP domain containing protein n=1 Tax=Asbolus verrucosus TaxID=1661398 RepID=A0A482VWC1_ASBVE|nr:PBP GOBP domain containing protein [Asbolus verrucosus]